MANAGHLAPYCNGSEVAVESGLPLGLSAEVDYDLVAACCRRYADLSFRRVVEAQNASGELFGFERAQAIGTESAERIAQAAHALGQRDDITVLTLQYTSAEVLLA